MDVAPIFVGSKMLKKRYGNSGNEVSQYCPEA